MTYHHLVAAAAAALLSALPVSPASAAVAQGEWTGTAGSTCATATCEVTAESTTCAETTTVGNVSVVAVGCLATLTASHSRFRSGTTYFCVGLGSGTLSYTDSFGVQYPSVPVTVAVDAGTLTYRGSAVYGAEVITVQGVVTEPCTQSGAFTGTLSRV